MSSGLFALLEFIVVFGGVLWFGWSQLRTLKKRKQRLQEAANNDESSENS